MYCSKCGAQNQDDSVFCSKCGTSLPTSTVTQLHCSKCGAQNAEGSKFCSKCGNNLVPQPEDNSLTKLEIEEVRRFERRGWMVTIVGLIIVVIGLLVGVGSTATRYIGNFEYETYHPNAEIGMIIVVGGFVIALIGAIGVTFYHNKRLQLTKRLK